MELYHDCLEDLFSEPKERTFVDRTEILALLNDALIELNEDPMSYRIFSIHGIGGIGKTRLLREFSKSISPEPVVFVSFEIEKRSDVINNLYQIRKEIGPSCPFFDYALLRYWEMTNPTALNDSFMDLFQGSFFTSLLDFVSETVNVGIGSLKTELPRPSVITPSTILDFMNKLYRKVPQLRHSALFKAISSTSSDQLIHKLPSLLGIEIKRLIATEKLPHPVFIFDSYQESQPYSESEEWLYHLIAAIGQGLFIITSREPIHWRENNDHLIVHHLQCYPEKEARALLEETITDQPDLVDMIIESTQCVPIYIDLALNVYENEKTIDENSLVDKALFGDRHKLVQHFVNHMKPSWQSAVLDLATIRVFDRNIFIHLINCRMLDCTPYEYETIIQSDLFHYVSKSNNCSLVKLHDVFCKDVQNGRPVSEFCVIYQAYLDYLCYRRDYLVTENNGATLAALFQNALYLAISLEDRASQENGDHLDKVLDTKVIEQLLDIFFTLVANKVCFVPPSFEGIKTETMKKVCQFVYIKTYEKVNTLKTIKSLEQIGDVSCFGKHQLSYEAVLYYTKSLAGHYNELEAWVSKIDEKLDEQSKCEWFYSRVKLYQADCDMLHGQFKSALGALTLLENSCSSPEDIYSIRRTIGHIQRFNFQLNEAFDTYNALMKDYHKNTVFREYLSANLAETQCYFPDAAFIKRAKKLLESMETPYNIKNKGKVLYALAIANTVKRHYGAAQKNIDECVRINREDGYQSGELFGYMAQAYLDYAQIGVVADETNNTIERFLTENNAYAFFRLQLAIMKEDLSAISNIKSGYGWLDFDYTEKEFRQFLLQIRNT